MILMIYGFFIILIIISIYILFQNNNLNALIAYGIFGAAISGIFFLMNAPDVALVEITVGSAFIFFIYLIAIKKVAKIKVLYLETPYMIEEINDELRGFEYNLIKEFLDEKGLEANFIKINLLRRNFLFSHSKEYHQNYFPSYRIINLNYIDKYYEKILDFYYK